VPPATVGSPQGEPAGTPGAAKLGLLARSGGGRGVGVEKAQHWAVAYGHGGSRTVAEQRALPAQPGQRDRRR
jgi:hypothetical protein